MIEAELGQQGRSRARRTGREREGGRERGPALTAHIAGWLARSLLTNELSTHGAGKRQLVTSWGREEHECNAHLASLAFRYRPEEDSREEGWETHVIPETQGDH